MKMVLIVIGVLIVGFLVLGSWQSNKPEFKQRSRDREVISLCWEEQQRKSLTPAMQRTIAGACEKMERDFFEKHGMKP